MLEAEDQVPADLRLSQVNGLRVDESADSLSPRFRSPDLHHFEKAKAYQTPC